MTTAAALLTGATLRRVLLALAAGGHIRVKESPAGDVVAVTRPAGTGQRGTYMMELATGRWGLYRREMGDHPEYQSEGLYRLLRLLDVDMAAIARAIGD